MSGARRWERQRGLSLAEQHRPFALKIARTYMRGRGAVTKDEIVSAAFYGLVRAERYFEPDRGFRFITYAVAWVHRQIILEFRHAALVHVPEKVQAERMQSGDARFNPTHSLDAPIRKLDGDRTPADELVDTQADQHGALYASEKATTVRAAVDALPERHATVIRLRFGLGDYSEPLTLHAIGVELGLSRERIRQIESEALGMLRGERCPIKLRGAAA